MSHASSSIGIELLSFGGSGLLLTISSSVSSKGEMCTSLSCSGDTLGTATTLSCLSSLATGTILFGSGVTNVYFIVVVCVCVCVCVCVSIDSPVLFILLVES